MLNLNIEEKRVNEIEFYRFNKSFFNELKFLIMVLLVN